MSRHHRTLDGSLVLVAAISIASYTFNCAIGATRRRAGGDKLLSIEALVLAAAEQ